MKDDLWFMSLAFEQAEKAFKMGEVPVGAVLVDEQGAVIASAHNLKESDHNPCGHAEIILLTAAGKELNNWRMSQCKLYVTLEPCLMCLGACIHARIKKLIFGAYDSKYGALSLGYHFHQDSRLNHKFSVVGGVDHFRCSSQLSNFFRLKRKSF